MQAQQNNDLLRARGSGSKSLVITLAVLILIALLAGLIYCAIPAQAVSTVHILDDANGGMCRDMGWSWDTDTKTCTMTEDLTVSGIDAIHIESDNVTLDGDGHAINGSAGGNGITVDGIRNVTVRGLYISGFIQGIYVRDSRDTAIAYIDVTSNNFGAYVSGSDCLRTSILHGSYTFNGYGIVMVNGPQETQVISNTVSSNSYGIQLGGSGTTGSAIFGNVISSNTYYGLTIDPGPSGNSVYNNIFDGNGTHAAVFTATGNSFNQPAPLGGNWWSGWTSPDDNSDGFVDSPYVFTGGQDNLPWVTQYDWDPAPVISNVQPSGAIRIGMPTITASYIDNEPTTGVNIASVSANFTSGSYPSALACTANGSPGGTISCTPADSLVSGHYDFEVHITDNRGNVGTGTGSFDVTPYHITDTTNGGDCALIGTWDAGTKTCMLTTDLNMMKMDGIHIESDNVTLDGGGHILTGQRTAIADTSGVKISGRTGVTLRNLTVRGFEFEFELRDSSNLTITGNTASYADISSVAFYMWSVSTSTFSGNTAADHLYGIDSRGSPGNTFTGNTISGNNYIGIFDDGGDTFVDNIISGNSVGFFADQGGVSGGGPSTLYHNSFISNVTQVDFHHPATYYFDGGATVGGNYWSDYDTPAEGCNDVNGDGYCDAPYVTPVGQDNYPFAAQYGWDGAAPTISNVQPSGTIRNGNPAITASYSDEAPSIGIDTASATVVFTSYPHQAPDDYVCTAVGSPDGTISCTQQGSPIYPLSEGHYEFQVSISDNEGNTTTANGSFDFFPYHIYDMPGGYDCSLFGIWDDGTKTCILTTDLAVSDLDGIHIESDGVTLDGNGHSLTNTETISSVYWGVYVARTGVTVKNLTVSGFYAGIFLPGASGNTISGNHLTGNVIGAFIPYAGPVRPSGNLIIGNDMSNNSYAGLNFISASDSRIVDNTFTGNDDLCVITDEGGGLKNTGLIFSGNTCSGSPDGFWVGYTDNSRFIGNSVQCDDDAFWLNQSDNNLFERNIISTGGTGFASWGTPDNDNNEFFSNSFIRPSGEFVAFNLVDGVEAGNIFNREFGGGNYYSWHDAPGFEGCSDVNSDGFCDTAYGQDQRPWTTDGAWAPDYYWTWYDNLYGSNWVLMANPASAPADSWFDLVIAGDDVDPGAANGYVPPGGSLTPAYPGTIGGPVEVNHHGPGQAITSQRILWAGNSLDEVPGIEADKLSSHYYWTWYDMQTPGYKNWVLVANPGIHGVYYEIRIAGTLKDSGLLFPGENVTPTFPGVMGGPVEVIAWSDEAHTTPADVFASQRVLMNSDTAFNEEPGIPAEELSTRYLWTWYDNQSPGAQNWVLVANPKDYTIYYEIKVVGVVKADGSLSPAGQEDSIAYPSFAPALMGGPVEVAFWKDQVRGSLITEGITSQRVLWGPSFEETPGYPYDRLDSSYHWTWYDQKSTGALNWVMVALDPAETQQVHVTVTYTDEDGIPRTGSADLDPAVSDQRRWYWSDPGYRGGPVEVTAYLKDYPETPKDVIASQRVLWNGFFNEVPGTVLGSF